MSEIVKAFRRFKGLPATGDLAAVAELCAAPQVLAGTAASANSALSASASATLPQHEGVALGRMRYRAS